MRYCASRGRDEFVRLRGVAPDLEAAVLDTQSETGFNLFAAMAERPDGIIVSARLAASLGMFPGEQVSLYSWLDCSPGPSATAAA